MARPYHVSPLVHPFPVPVSSRTRLTGSTMVQRLRLGQRRIGLDREPGISGGTLVLPPHLRVVVGQSGTACRLDGHSSWEGDSIPPVDGLGKAIAIGLLMMPTGEPQFSNHFANDTHEKRDDRPPRPSTVVSSSGRVAWLDPP